MKTCSRCQQELSEDMFYDSNPWTCRPCVRIRSSERYRTKTEECKAAGQRWVEKNRERSRQIKQAYREQNRETEREYHRARRAFQPEKVKEVQDRYKAANPEVYSEATAARRAAEAQAVPKWADRRAIKVFYAKE